jgi:hypothetical protein
MNAVHTGHIGDIIAFLPLFKAAGGEFLYVRDDPGMVPMSGFKYNSLVPLLKSQGINVSFMDTCGGSVTIEMGNWRECYKNEISLTDSQARYMGLVNRYDGHFEIKEPWIKVQPDPLTKDRVIFNRTPRYRNPTFPWCSVHKHFGDRALFVGTPEEHTLFVNEIGPIERYETADCLAVARAIKGSDYFVGNQSSSFWIAAAMFHPLLQEVDQGCPNSIVPFDRATYCRDGNINFENL